MRWRCRMGSGFTPGAQGLGQVRVKGRPPLRPLAGEGGPTKSGRMRASKPGALRWRSAAPKTIDSACHRRARRQVNRYAGAPCDLTAPLGNGLCRPCSFADRSGISAAFVQQKNMDANRHAGETRSPLGDEVVRQGPKRSEGAAQPLDSVSAAWPARKESSRRIPSPARGRRWPSRQRRSDEGLEAGRDTRTPCRAEDHRQRMPSPCSPSSQPLRGRFARLDRSARQWPLLSMFFC
jgi:hypothetical protein